MEWILDLNMERQRISDQITLRQFLLWPLLPSPPDVPSVNIDLIAPRKQKCNVSSRFPSHAIISFAQRCMKYTFTNISDISCHFLTIRYMGSEECHTYHNSHCKVSLSAFKLGFYSCLTGLFGTTFPLPKFYILGCKEICVDSVILKFGRSATELPHLVEVPCFVFQNIQGGKVQTQFCQSLNFESTFLKSPSLHSNEKFRGPSGVSPPWFYFITWKAPTFPILSEKFWAPFGQNLSFSSLLSANIFTRRHRIKEETKSVKYL